MQILSHRSGMKTQITSMYSTFDSTEYYNSSEIATQLTTTWTNEEIGRFIHVIVRPFLFIFGNVGNCLTIYIMRRTSLNDVSSCFYMFVLAQADTHKYEFS